MPVKNQQMRLLHHANWHVTIIVIYLILAVADPFLYITRNCPLGSLISIGPQFIAKPPPRKCGQGISPLKRHSRNTEGTCVTHGVGKLTLLTQARPAVVEGYTYI